MRWSWGCSQCLPEATKLRGEDRRVQVGAWSKQAGFLSCPTPHTLSFPGCWDPWFLTSPTTVLPFTSFTHPLLTGGTKTGRVSISLPLHQPQQKPSHETASCHLHSQLYQLGHSKYYHWSKRLSRHVGQLVR